MAEVRHAEHRMTSENGAPVELMEYEKRPHKQQGRPGE